MADLKLTKCCCRDKVWVGMIGPFARAVVLEYGLGDYRGSGHVPVSGVAQCSKCKSCWVFASSDRTGDVITYSARKCHSNAVDSLIAVWAPLAKPKWPLWIPPGIAPNKSMAEIKAKEDYIWEHAEPVSHTFSTKHVLNGRILTHSGPTV